MDECSSKGDNACSIDAICENTIGSYTCSCNEGYKGDGFECEGMKNKRKKKEKEKNKQKHKNTDKMSNKLIIDVDECASKSDNTCNINAICENTIGSYNCSCNEGYKGDGFEWEGMKKKK